MLDYVTQNLIDEGSPLGFTYLPSDLVSIFSPIGLVEGCANEDNGKLLYDFILSKEGQEILVENNLLSTARAASPSMSGAGAARPARATAC